MANALDSIAMDENRCRLCLIVNPKTKLFLNESIVGDIQMCCNIQVDFHDKLPKFICVLCSQEMLNIIKFKNMCESNDKFLRKKLYYSDNIDIDIETESKFCLDSIDIDAINIKNENLHLDDSIYDGLSNVMEDLSSEIDDYNYDLKEAQENDKYVLIVDPIKKSTSPTFESTKCNLCNRNINKNNIKNHISMMPDDEKFQCKHCKSLCVSKTCYRSHVHIHSMTDLKVDKVVHMCPYCNKTFTNVAKYAKHLRDHNPQSFQCDICSKKFRMKSYLIKHLKSHKKSCICQYCGKIFKDPYLANKHVKSHLISNLVKCDLCGKTMKKGSIKQHLYSHKGEKNYECDICKRKFISKTCVKSHIAKHYGTKPHKCNFCKMKFASRKTYTDHVKLHTGERPYRCPICDKGFIQLSNMKSHFRNNHKGIEFIFKNKRELKRDMLIG